MQPSALVLLLRAPTIISRYSNRDWNLLLQQAHASDMLARVEAIIKAHDLLEHVPDQIKRHFASEEVKIKHLHVQVKEEVRLLNRVFSEHNISPIYLKGTAYLLNDLPLASSRMFGDIDILLDKNEIADIEHALKYHGWFSQKTDDHDQAYYRDYMHEIPPMQNIERGAILDIHHNILPICNNNTIEIAALTQHKKQVNQQLTAKASALEYVLSPEALFMHSAIHLFHEGEFDKGLRGLSDLDLLFSDFSENEADFSQRLISLAQEIHQQKSLYFAWHYLQLIFERSLNKIANEYVSSYQRNNKPAKINDFIFCFQLDVHHQTTRSWQFTLSSQLAYWRGHLLRMPIRLLIPHLLKKSWLEFQDSFTKQAKREQNIAALNPRFKAEDND